MAFVIMLAVCNPLAIGIGWNLTESGHLAAGILKSLSAGILLYF
jgi:hypothetical protein